MKKRVLCFLMALLCLAAALPAVAGPADERRIVLSGLETDAFVAEQDCYAEGDEVIVFFQKGVTIRGDMLARVERVMADLGSFTGMTYARKEMAPEFYNDYGYFEPGVFDHVNAGMDKVAVMVAALGEYSPWAYGHMAVVDIADMTDDTCFALYHELTHVLYMRNGADLGLTLNEGLATCTVDRISREKGIPVWTTQFYMDSPDFDASLITSGADGFRHMFENSDDNYCYGYRFVTFLMEEYGRDIIPRILDAAGADGFNPNTGEDEQADLLADTEHMKRILTGVAGADVFDRFARWHEAEMPRVLDEYLAYMTALGAY